MLKGLSLEILIGKFDTVVRVENKIKIFVKREYVGFPGVRDHRMLHIDMIQSTWETLLALHAEEVGRGQVENISVPDVNLLPINNRPCC